MPMNLTFLNQNIEEPGLPWSNVWSIPTVAFNDPVCQPLQLIVLGNIRNATSLGRWGKRSLQDWKVRIATRVKERRGDRAWFCENEFAISLGLRFHNDNHRGQKLDAENYIKPILDALAAGLFCSQEWTPKQSLIGLMMTPTSILC